MSAPSVTIELLDELVKFGFTDDIFHIVNNFNNDTIAQYEQLRMACNREYLRTHAKRNCR